MCLHQDTVPVLSQHSQAALLRAAEGKGEFLSCHPVWRSRSSIENTSPSKPFMFPLCSCCSPCHTLLHIPLAFPQPYNS